MRGCRRGQTKQSPGVDDVLMPSTPSAYPQVISGRLTSFRVLEIEVFPARGNFCAWFDSRQLHQRKLGKAKSLGQLSFHRHLISIGGLSSHRGVA
jgi:hypothetical protein